MFIHHKTAKKSTDRPEQRLEFRYDPYTNGGKSLTETLFFVSTSQEGFHVEYSRKFLQVLIASYAEKMALAAAI